MSPDPKDFLVLYMWFTGWISWVVNFRVAHCDCGVREEANKLNEDLKWKLDKCPPHPCHPGRCLQNFVVDQPLLLDDPLIVLDLLLLPLNNVLKILLLGVEVRLLL